MADPRKPDRMWPGAEERGLQKLPDLSPIVVDLAVSEAQCWMNELAAEREKGAPLTTAEKRRIYRGRPWRSPRARERLAQQKARAQQQQPKPKPPSA